MRIFIVGGTGQARLCHHMLVKQEHSCPIVFDRSPSVKAPWDCEIFHDPDLIANKARNCDGFLVCIGGPHGRDRQSYSEMLLSLGLEPISVIHPTAFIGDTVKLGRGLQIMPGAVINEFSQIGDWCIFNSNSTVDHDARIGNGVHIMPGATIAGQVRVDDFGTIGTNATVLPNIRIGTGCFIGAGANVVRDAPPGAVMVGNPARPMRRSMDRESDPIDRDALVVERLDARRK